MHLRGIWEYWKPNFTTSKEAGEKVSAYIITAVSIALFLMGYFRVPWPRVQKFLDSDVASWIEALAGIYALGYFFLWLPFKRHQEQQFALISAQQALQDLVDENTERDRPKLKIEFTPDVPGCCVPNHNNSHYVRLLVTLDARQEATACSAILICVERESDGKVLYNHESISLPFTPSESADSTSKTLMPERGYFLDLLVIHELTSRLLAPREGGAIYVLKGKDNRDIFERHDTYILTINMAGKGIPTQLVRARFKWTGNYHTIDYSIAT